MIDLVIKNGWVVAPGGTFLGGVAIDGERIVRVAANGDLPQARRTIDAREQYVIPGLIDGHVHMGSEEDATLEDGLRQNMPVETNGSLYGGVTTFGHFVGRRSEPLIPNIITTIREGNRSSRIDYFFHAFINSEGHLAEQAQVYALGVTSFKHFFNAYKARPAETMAYFGGPVDSGMLYRSLRFCATQGHPAMGIVHAEDIDIIAVKEDELRTAGRRDLAAWTEARPSVAEVSRILVAIEVAKAAGAPLSIAHMSTGEGADIVSAARRQGLPIWAEATPHHLTHTCDMEADIGCWGKTNPPLRSIRDIDRLWKALLDDGVTTIGSDTGTGGRTRAGKEKGGGKHQNIWSARSGIRGGMEHLLPVLLTKGVNAGRITMEDLVRVGSTNPARLYGLYPRKGALVPGADGDVVIVDLNRKAPVGDDFYHGLCETGIYLGWTFRGFARTTVVRGRVMMEDFETVNEAGWGRYVPRGPAASDWNAERVTQA
jgi:dihydropyrimidinase